MRMIGFSIFVVLLAVFWGAIGGATAIIWPELPLWIPFVIAGCGMAATLIMVWLIARKEKGE